MAATVSPLGTFGLTCIFGQVNVFQTGLIGAVNGTITPLFSSPIPITQVVGPAGGNISLNLVNGQFALVCGNFVPSGGRCQLNVTTVIPIGLGGGGFFPGTAGLGGIGLGGTGLGGLLGGLLGGTGGLGGLGGLGALGGLVGLGGLGGGLGGLGGI